MMLIHTYTHLFDSSPPGPSPKYKLSSYSLTGQAQTFQTSSQLSASLYIDYLFFAVGTNALPSAEQPTSFSSLTLCLCPATSNPAHTHIHSHSHTHSIRMALSLTFSTIDRIHKHIIFKAKATHLLHSILPFRTPLQMQSRTSTFQNHALFLSFSLS